jgi:DNA-binding response OmpR family regulator
MTVLVVEDEVLIGEMVSDVLVDHGYDVQLFSNAADAMRYMVDGQPIDVLFTDINIAGEVDGTTLAQQARDLRPDLPIVFASGRLQMLEHLSGYPRVACLPKPYSPAQVCAIVEGLFATRH